MRKKPWSDDMEQWWAEWLKARFGSIHYWKLPREVKEEHFRDCAREIALALKIHEEG